MSALTYRGNYLESLPRPSPLNAHELIELQQQIAPNLKYPGSTAIKSATLRALVRLRSSRALSPLARVVPMHLQRRVKSWLGN